ncbi:hypothetical protein ACFE04_022963 [Oxalis oulophora]
MQNLKPHVGLLASPGIGHIIPVLELGRCLLTNHNFTITIFVLNSDDSSSAQSQILKSQNPNLNIVYLPLPDISTLVQPSDSFIKKLSVIMHESVPSLRSILGSMQSRPSVLIVDLFGTQALAVAEEFHMLKYVFITTNAWFLWMTMYLPRITKGEEEDHINRKQDLKIPGCEPVRFVDTIHAYVDPKNIKEIGLEMGMADGILVNTFEELEMETLNSFKNKNLMGRVCQVPVYPIGPILRPVQLSTNGITNWLNNQPNESVLYVSFGSGGTLTMKQITELAWGLELSKQRFIWVVRPPTDDDVSATFFTVTEEKIPFPDTVIGREEILKMVRRIMVDKEGNEIRNRVKKLKNSANKAVSQNGSSTNSLALVAKECEKSLRMFDSKNYGA